MRHYKIFSLFVGTVALTSLSFMSAPSAEAQGKESFKSYLASVKVKAAAQGVKQSTLNRIIPNISYNDRVVRLDRKQPEGNANKPIPNFEPYRRRHVDTARINGGKRKLSQIRSILQRIENETGVPKEIMIAIYGHETNYGNYTGNFNAPSALASLAYEGRRRKLFEAELIAVIKMIDMGVPQSGITGSWAGALGKPQFLPSVYLRLAKDGDGDGFADIWNNESDAMASIANYFVNAGWRRDQEWGFAVNIPQGLNRAAIKNKTVSPRCKRVFARHSQWKTMKEWRALGLSPRRGFWAPDDQMAVLLEPDGIGKPGYLLLSNYRVILDYNCSNFYALSVGLLADAVK